MFKLNGKRLDELRKAAENAGECAEASARQSGAAADPALSAAPDRQTNQAQGGQKPISAQDADPADAGETALTAAEDRADDAAQPARPPTEINDVEDELRRRVRVHALERERKQQKRIERERGRRRNRRRVVLLAALILASSAIAAFSLGGNQAKAQQKSAEYSLASLDTVIDTTSVNGKIVPVEVSNDGTEIIDFESEINQFRTDDGGFVLYDSPQEDANAEETVGTETDLPLPEEVAATPAPTPTPVAVSGYAVLSVDGAIVATLGSGEDAQWLIDKLLEAFEIPKGGTLIQRGFVEKVEVLSQDEKPQNLTSREEAYLLLKGRLNVRMEIEQSVEEAIKYSTKYVDDATMNQGLKKTTVEGKNGKQQSLYSVVYVNGKQQTKKLTAKKVLEEPITAVVAVGTKVVYSSSGYTGGSYAPGKVPMGADYPNIDKTLSKPTPNEGIMGPAPGNLRFIYPVSGSISSYFGWRWGRMHYGIDLPNTTGTPVKASEGGVVTSYTGVHSGYGYIVEISHGNGFTTRYAHLDKILVTVGQHVNQGDVIGTIGSSGTQTSGPHLHFEIRNTGTPYNPLFYLNR